MGESIKPLLYGTYVKPQMETIQPLLYASWWNPIIELKCDTLRNVTNPALSVIGQRFDGTSYVTLPALLSGRKVFTIEMVISTSDTYETSQNWNDAMLVGFFTGGTGNAGFGIMLGGGYLQEHSDFSSAIGTTNWNISDSTQHRITYLSDGTNTTICLDGTPYQTRGKVSRNIGNNNIFVAYNNLDGSGNHKAVIALYDLRIWGKALTADEIGASIDGTEDGLLAWYECNDESGSTFADSSGNGNDGTVTGTLLPVYAIENGLVSRRHLQDIAAAIRAASGSQASLLPSDMAGAIASATDSTATYVPSTATGRGYIAKGTLQAIASAIRTRDGSTARYTPSEMAAAIARKESGV